MFFLPFRQNPVLRAGIPVVTGGWPVLGHFLPMSRDFLHFIQAAETKYGKLFWVDGGFGRDSLICTDPEVFNAFRSKALNSESFQALGNDFLGQSLVVHDGPKHSRMRSAMNAPFTPKGLSGTELGPMMAEVIEQVVSRFEEGQTLRILHTTRELTLNVLFRMIGAPVEELPQWRHHYEEFMLMLIPPNINLPGFPHYRGLKAKKWLDQRLMALIQRTRENPEPGKLLTQLVQGKDENGEGQSEQELLDNLRLLVLAGHETTASTMAWMAVVLGRAPQLWEKLVAEATAAPEVPRAPKALRNFPYAEGVFREALRLHPPAIQDGRRVQGEFRLCGQLIPVGTNVTIPIMALSRNPAQYPEPEQFRPERWVEKQGAIEALELVQFGGGHHFCLGYHVAWMESVQFGVALARQLSAKGLRLLHEGPYPKFEYLPLLHMPTQTQVRIVKA